MWRDEFLVQINYDSQKTRPFPFVVLGNKIDVGDQKISKARADSWCQNNQIPLFETSAKDAINVERAFYMVARNALATNTVCSADHICHLPIDPPTQDSGSCCFF